MFDDACRGKSWNLQVMPRKCKVCKTKFEQVFNTMQSTCGNIECAIEYGNKLKEKTRKVESSAFKKAVRDKDRSWHIKTCQTAFNRYIRLRDADEPCISCQRHHQGQYHAGHWKSVGSSPELRFNEDNNNKQCSVCNNHRSGNVADYRVNLIKKIGIARVSTLEGPHDPKKYTVEYLKDLTAHYRKLIRGLEDAA